MAIKYSQELSWFKKAAKMALEDRQRVKNGDLTPFIFPLALALTKDGLFDIVPVVGKVFSICIAIYIFIFMWGRGKWKVRLVVFILSLLDIIPFVDILPMETMAVLYGYYVARKDAIKAKKHLTFLEQATNNLRRVEQLAFQREQHLQREQEEQISQETARDERYNKEEAANDARYAAGNRQVV